MDKAVVLIIKRTVILLGLFSVVFFVLSCKKEVKQIEVSSLKDTENREDIETNEENDSVVEFPKTGNKITDFVLAPYEIQYQEEGLLDDDGLKDVVIVLQDKNDNTSSRPTLVLIKQPQGGYKLQEISWVAIGPEYTADDYKIYNDESVSISNKEIIFSMYGMGATGNKETLYKFVNNELLLISINTFNMGAGGQSTMDYNVLTGDISFVEVNTMIDSMPSTLTKKVLKLKHQIVFSKDDPETVLDSIFKMDQGE